MIVNVRGTSGSGKTHLVRSVMERYPVREPHFEEGRKRPLFYALYGREQAWELPPLTVVGHYEIACGGCDTIPSYDKTFEVVRALHARGWNVLFEGLLLSPEVRRTAELHADGLPLLVAAIDEPLQLCLDSVNARRAAKNPERGPVNPKNTASKHDQTRKAIARLRAAGVETFTGNRAEVLAEVLRRLGLPAEAS